MNLTRFLNGTRFCMSPDTDGGGASGAPASASADTNSNPTASATVSTTAGDAAKVSNDQSSATASVPAGVGSQPPANDAGDFKTRLGEFGKDPALASFNSEADLAKSYLETKKLVGQKLGIPGPDATPEAKAAFYEALGVPKEASGYEFKQPEGLPEALKSSYDQAHADKWAARMKELGIPKEAANTLRNEFFAEISEEIKGMNAEIEKSDEQFGKMAAEIYGDNAKATQALQNVRTMVEKHVPAQLKNAMDQLPNSALLIMASVIKGETSELTGEDKTISRDSGTASDGKTVAQLRDEARALQALPEYASPFTAKGKTAHEDVVSKVKAIYDRIGKMGV